MREAHPGAAEARDRASRDSPLPGPAVRPSPPGAREARRRRSFFCIVSGDGFRALLRGPGMTVVEAPHSPHAEKARSGRLEARGRLQRAPETLRDALCERSSG